MCVCSTDILLVKYNDTNRNIIYDLPNVFVHRYIDTFAGLLAGQIRVNAAPLHLTHVSVAGSLASTATPTIAFLKIYENFVCVYTSGTHFIYKYFQFIAPPGRCLMR